MKNNPPPIMLSSGYAKMLVSDQMTFIAKHNAKAPVNFKLAALLKGGKKTRREMYLDYYQNQYK